MVDNQHKRIPGYRDFNEAELAAIQDIKGREADMAAFVNNLLSLEGVETDSRELALARTHFEDAFIHLTKSVARPDSPWDFPIPRK